MKLNFEQSSTNVDFWRIVSFNPPQKNMLLLKNLDGKQP